MVLGRIEFHSLEQDVAVIMDKVKLQLIELGYTIRSPQDQFSEYQTLRISQGFFHWLLDFSIKLSRTGNLVSVEITRQTPFSFDKIIEDRRKRMERRRSQTQTSFLGSIWRFWWLAYILSFVAGIVLSFLPTNDPFTFLGYALLGVFGLSLILYLLNVIQRSYLKRNEIEKADLLTKQLETIFASLNSETSSEKMICWSCFKEIIPKDHMCPECGVKLIKI